MNVSWNWLLQYVDYTGDREEAIRLMTMSGLNVDAVELLPGGDFLLDVEVTSNRPDCLGHLGIARELAALTDSKLLVPETDYNEGDEKVADLASVEVADPVGCSRYTARVIRGVKVGPSPAWLCERLEAVGLRPVNNVVDVTNYVLYEHGQPLHAFNCAILKENRIVVRRAQRGEAFVAIDHSQHRLEAADLVIADAERVVAMAGVMGGADSEVDEQTVDVLLESAVFDPLSVRTTSRARALLSDSSYRFERGVDFDGADWASRRACRLIQQIAGGTVARGVVDVNVPPPEPPTLTLRMDRIARVLGITVPTDEVLRILKALGMVITKQSDATIEVTPPRFRRDLSREADLIEEVARIHGFDKVPYLAYIPSGTPPRVRQEEVIRRVQDVLVAAGYHEAITPSLTDAQTAALLSPGDDTAPLGTRDTLAAGATFIRKSVLSGLLEVKRTNQAAGQGHVAMFEMARSFCDSGSDTPPSESRRLALLSDDDETMGRGTLEAIAEGLNFDGQLTFAPTTRVAELNPDGQADVLLDGAVIGFCGLLGETLARSYKFRHVPWVAEVDVDPLVEAASLVPQHAPVPQLPTIERDLALVVDETVLWRDMEACLRSAEIEELEQVSYVSLFRGKQIPEGKKCVAVRLTFRGSDTTLTHEQADVFQEAILARVQGQLGAELRAS
jgi:phenylalanyl-tRNA synthetase beta chain